MHQSVADAFFPFTIPLEGRVNFMYLDVKSLVSTGIGNLLDADSSEHFGTNPTPLPDIFTLNWTNVNTGALASNPEISAEYTRVKFSGTSHATLAQKEAITTLRITDADIDNLVRNKLASFEATLQGRPEFSNLQNWPADAQLGLFSMAWALGPLFRFPRFQAAAASEDWFTCAAESHMDETGNPGIIPRNVRNGLLFTLAGWMAAPPPGTFSALVYDPNISLAENMRSGNFPIPLTLDIGLQTALERLAFELNNPGYDPRGIDGGIGPNTRTALTTFQSDFGLPQTPGAKHVGDVGTATIDAIAAQFDSIGISYLR